MGIDVWVRRLRVANPTARVAPVPVVDRIDTPVRVLDHAAAASTQMSGLQVNLDCMAAPGIVIVGRLTNPLDRRMARDIVLTVAGARADVQRAQFRWPLTQTGDASAAAAGNAYRGFLRGQLERAHARWLLLLGASSSALLDPVVAVGDATLLRLPEASALRADPIAKQRLWLNVSQQAPA